MSPSLYEGGRFVFKQHLTVWHFLLAFGLCSHAFSSINPFQNRREASCMQKTFNRLSHRKTSKQRTLVFPRTGHRSFKSFFSPLLPFYRDLNNNDSHFSLWSQERAGTLASPVGLRTMAQLFLKVALFRTCLLSTRKGILIHKELPFSTEEKKTPGIYRKENWTLQPSFSGHA